MSFISRKDRYTEAEEFLLSMASSVPGWSQVTSTDDVEGVARRLTDYVAGKLAAHDIESILKLLDHALRRDARSTPPCARTRLGKGPRPNVGDRYRKVDKLDPYYWG